MGQMVKSYGNVAVEHLEDLGVFESTEEIN